MKRVLDPSGSNRTSTTPTSASGLNSSTNEQTPTPSSPGFTVRSPNSTSSAGDGKNDVADKAAAANSTSSGTQQPGPSSSMDDSPASSSSGTEDSSQNPNSVDGASPPKKFTLSYEIEDYTQPSHSSNHELKTSYGWKSLLSEPDFCAAPVTGFKHAPLSDCWDYMTIGMKVEVENTDMVYSSNAVKPCYWIASILRFNGYQALLRYEGFGQDGSKDFWMNICSDKVHPVGYCITKGKALVPPLSIKNKYPDFKDFLVKRLTGARTTPQNFYAKIWESVTSAFRPGMKLEVVDKMRICQVRVATIKDITGRRLFLTYDDVDHDDNGFWCHEESPLIHPVGWAKRVGHQIVASQEYYNRCALENFGENDCTPDMFPEYSQPPGTFSVAMKIEAVDPLNLASICVATVMKVLRFGYIMIRIDGYETDETGSDWFCYHASSSLIFPPGFCNANNLRLKPPAGFEENFTWHNYLKETTSTAAPVGLFAPRDEFKHAFRVGMKLEAADQMDPRLICVSTVSRVVGRLLKIHFDGWEDDYDQWMDCESVDIYPVGWAEIVGHKLEGPRQALPQKAQKRKPVSRKGKKRTSAGSGSTPGGTGGNASAGNSTAASTNSRGKKKATGSSPTGSAANAASASPAASASSPASREDTPTSRTPPPPVLEPQTNVSTPTPLRLIPRLVDSAGQASSMQRGRDVALDPASWTVDEVAQFLAINECASLVDSFTEQKVDGSRFLSLAKEDVMKLVNSKIGPCLKVENLLSLLKARMNPAQARYLATIRK